MPLVKTTFGFRRKHIRPTPLTADELERITAPTLVLLGGHSQLYDAREVAATVTAHMPHAVAEIIPGASHDVVLSHPDELAARIVACAARPCSCGPQPDALMPPSAASGPSRRLKSLPRRPMRKLPL